VLGVGSNLGLSNPGIHRLGHKPRYIQVVEKAIARTSCGLHIYDELENEAGKKHWANDYSVVEAKCPSKIATRNDGIDLYVTSLGRA